MQVIEVGMNIVHKLLADISELKYFIVLMHGENSFL